MLFKDIYDKPIDRPIDAVVKASSVEHLANELEEYVVTPELAGHLTRFFDEYNDPDATGNGAWISGFFGSGKSHMLKILAVLLQDQEVAGRRAYDYILPKLDDEPALKGALEVARQRHPSESILFNIDTVAPNQGRTEAGALLAAFIKLFNSHCGYFDGDQQHIAEMEYDLDREGRLGAFVSEVEESTGKRWTDLRKSAPIYAKRITAAFDSVCGNEPGSTDNIVSYYQKSYQPSIHSFAERVKGYIEDRQVEQPGFRLNFFVDEVGQFIAQNVNLMVNLQSIAEELNTVCDGASWVIVTSQENLEDTVGQMTERSANDFSKIQARFKIKMQLTSKDAKAVIKQRLLAKRRPAVSELAAMYAKNEADFRVLFDFADGSKRYKTYLDEEDFVDTYPFVPYQFDLFITAMRGLSDYNAFTGRHHSTGARSMLGVFQQVGIELSRGNGSTEGQDLATFDSMFEGLRNSLKSEVYGAISIAETNLSDNPLAIRVLKALLLVKYCKDFRATAGNLRVLLYSSFKENTATLESQIKEALAELERQLYIKRSANSNAYEYLTDEEKDIEKEIRNTEIQQGDVRSYIGDVFKDIVGAMKAPYENGGFTHSFPYNLKVDGDAIGRSRYDLTLDIVTDAPSGVLDVPSSGPKTLTVVLRDANAFMNDVGIFVKTRKYVNLANGTGEVRNAIITDKRQANTALSTKLREDFKEYLTTARYFAAGVEVTDEVGGSGKDAIASAMGILVKRSYTGLQQIRDNYSERDVYQNCLAAQSMMDAALPEYVETVFSWIALAGSGSTVTVGGDGAASLSAHFTKNEYGWPDVAVRNAVAILYAANRVEIRKSGSLLEGASLASALKSGADMDKLVVVKMESVSPERLAVINRGFRQLTGTNPTGMDAKAIAKELSSHFDQELPAYRGAQSRAAEYPFAAAYRDCLSSLDAAYDAVSKDWKWLAEQFPSRIEGLAQAKQEISAMKQFMEGSGAAAKWRDIKNFSLTKLSEAKELRIALLEEGSAIDDAVALVEDPECYKSREIPRAAGVIRRAVSEIEEAKAALRETVRRRLDEYRASYEKSYDLSSLPDDARARFAALFEEADEALASLASPYLLRTFVDDFKRQNSAELIALTVPRANPADDQKNPDGVEDGDPTPPKPAVKTVPIGKFRARAYVKPTIESKADVEKYLEALRAELSAEIDNGSIILK